MNTIFMGYAETHGLWPPCKLTQVALD